MRNFKKVIALSLSTICLLASCNKTLDADGAKKFVENTYANKEVKSLSSLEVVVNTKTNSEDEDVLTWLNTMVTNIAYTYGIEYKDKSYSLRGYSSENSTGFITFKSKDLCGSILESSDIQKYEDLKKGQETTGNVTYTTNSNELSVYCDFRVKNPLEQSVSESATELDIYNSNGQLRYMKSTQKYTRNNESVSLTATFSCSFAN